MSPYSQAVKTAQEKMMMTSKKDDYFTGGFDIMKKLVKKLRKDQKKKKALKQDFTIMKQVFEHPVPVKKNKKDSGSEPIEYAPDPPIAR
jgi:hypothetical protein